MLAVLQGSSGSGSGGPSYSAGLGFGPVALPSQRRSCHGKHLLESQEKIDEEIQDLEGRIRALRTSRNALALINQLPGEIFTEIFLCLQVPYLEGEFEPGRIVAWVLVTHVSKHWRAIAFSSKALWTTIPTHNTAYAQLASQLSSPLPIYITDRFNPLQFNETDDGDLGLFVPLLQRACKLEATHQAGFFANALQGAPLEFPFLQDIEFNQVDVPVQADRSPFPPLVRRLKLSLSRFQWDWMKFDHLTELHLCSCDSPEISINSFVKYLSQLPRLSNLEIRWIALSKLAEETYISDQHRPAMLTLQHLIIEDELFVTARFLSHVEFTKDFTLRAEVDVGTETPDEVEAFFQGLSRHLEASRRAVCRGSLILKNHNYLTLSCSDQDEPSPFLIIEGRKIHDGVFGHFLNWTQTLPFGKMQQFTTNAFKDLQEWQSCRLRGLESLQDLVVYSPSSPRALIKCLAAETVLAARSGNWKLLSFPALKKITLHGIRYSSISQEQNRKDTIAVFTRRAQHGLKVEELTFRVEGRRIPDDMVEQLRKVVGVVTVLVPVGNDRD
ncbi:hypothetical protein BDN72DRAFT_876123 [Pluteus cervinus]|uniref:Uncharacterized protein n=1 Tax=Pluteus cervinus TaxID=181527 RepID=A0ACD3B5Y7_9AGAR|nr:hypothetical protein BDN72DRAFT_876123 [Pluteus cervinus]